jgi:hypothetical protein
MGRFANTPVGLRDPNKLATTNMHNELAQALNALQPQFVTGQQRPARGSAFTFLARITDKGPNGEKDYTDERYWVKPAYIRGSTVANAGILPDDDPSLLGVSAITAINIAEFSLTGTPGVASHVLPNFTMVRVTACVDVGTPDTGSQKGNGPAVRYEFDRLPGWELPVDVTVHSGGAGGVSTTPTYTYDFTFCGRRIGTNQLPRNSRPVGEIAAATFGTAFWNYSTQKWELGWCNEAPTVEACT